MGKTVLVFVMTVTIVAGAGLAAYQVGDHINDFSLLDASGNQVSLYDFQNRVIFLDFWTDG
ncbi:redoxin domain-containing protein [bacterium]|nr:redoxin domain-containing protein [candidate division CSSED10-310 bacterium]